MTDRLVFFAPWEALCSDNRKYKFRFVLSDQYRESKFAIGDFATMAAMDAGWEQTTAMLGLSVVVTEPDRRIRDLNFSKGVKDGISSSGSIWADDSQVRVEHWAFAQGGPDVAWAGAWVTVWRLDPTLYPPRPASKRKGKKITLDSLARP